MRLERLEAFHTATRQAHDIVRDTEARTPNELISLSDIITGSKGVPGSLVLGGFDESRCAEGTSILMPGSANSSLVVGVQSISIADSTLTGGNVHSATAGSSSFFAVIDSSLPYLQLPREVCDVFEALFMLTFDPATGFYLVNDTVLEHNKAANATVTIQVGDTAVASVQSVAITMPYDAFDLSLSFPAFPRTTRYFPIRRAVDGINIMGRTFLQEAMLIVDYERRNFTIAQARYSTPMPPAQLVSIARVGHPVTAKSHRDRILVIVVPIVVVTLFVILTAVLWRLYLRIAKRKSPECADTATASQVPEMASASLFELQSPISILHGEKVSFEKQQIGAPVELEASAVSLVR